MQERFKTRPIEKHIYAGKEYFDLIASSDLSEMNKKNELYDTSDIFVTTSDGLPYNDQSGKPKYRIVLEEYNEKFVSEQERLARIIVLLEDAESKGLRLHYPKIELTESNNLIGQVINYSENINSIPLFSEMTEEATVVDYGSKYDNTYSVQSAERLEDRSSLGRSFDSRGYNVYVNKKAISDNRNYEMFNWRIVGKVTKNYDLAARIAGVSTQSGGTVSVGVIKVNTKRLYSDHYRIFEKLNEAGNPINIYNYNFANPVSTAASLQEDREAYWTVNLEGVTTEQARSFDFLILVVDTNTDISNYQQKIKAFLARGGCLLIDFEGSTIPDSVQSILPVDVGSSLQTGDFTSVNYNRTVSTAASAYSALNVFQYNQTWGIQTEIFDSGYGVYGLIPKKDGRAFNSSLNDYRSIYTNVGPIVVTLYDKSSTNNSQISTGTIIANTIELSKLAGADYLSSSGEAIPGWWDQPGPPPAVPTVQTDASGKKSIILLSESEGPLKLFYNSITLGLSNKYFVSSSASNIQKVNTPVVYHATKWYSSWAINGPTLDDNYGFNDVLMKSDNYDEYKIYKISKDQNGDLYREIDSDSYEQIFLKSFNENRTSSLDVLRNTSSQSVEYFIEFTNDTISPKGGTKLSSPIASLITTPYDTYEIPLDIARKPPAVKTTTISNPINIPSNFGSFYVIERPEALRLNRVNQPQIANDDPRAYFYDFKTSWRTFKSTQSSLNFDFSFNLFFTLKVPAKLQEWYIEKEVTNVPITGEDIFNNHSWVFANAASQIKVDSTWSDSMMRRVGRKTTNRYFTPVDLLNYTPKHSPGGGGSGGGSGGGGGGIGGDIGGSVVMVADFGASESSSKNHFPYTGDIGVGNTFDQYGTGSRR